MMFLGWLTKHPHILQLPQQTQAITLRSVLVCMTEQLRSDRRVIKTPSWPQLRNAAPAERVADVESVATATVILPAPGPIKTRPTVRSAAWLTERSGVCALEMRPFTMTQTSVHLHPAATEKNSWPWTRVARTERAERGRSWRELLTTASASECSSTDRSGFTQGCTELKFTEIHTGRVMGKWCRRGFLLHSSVHS